MGLGKQAKTLSRTQVKMISEYLLTNRYGLRDQTIFYLSTKAGLRAKEIAHLKWSMVMNSDGSVGDYLNLPNSSSKGNGGRVVPLNKDLKLCLTSDNLWSDLKNVIEKSLIIEVSTKIAQYMRCITEVISHEIFYKIDNNIFHRVNALSLQRGSSC